MSHQSTIKRITAPDIAARKGGEPIVVLTSYHAQSAALIDPHVDILMVGDSLGMVMHGLETTVPVPLDLMIAHAQAVVRGSERALVVVDMPFGSYEESPAAAFRSAARIMKETGCGAVKLADGYDFDMTYYRVGLSLSPGNEQLLYWGRNGVTNPGTRNYMGVDSPAVEAMIDTMLNSESRETFVSAVRALDRILTTGRYVIPIYQWNISRIAHAKELKFPEKIPMYGDWIGWQPDVWWYEED